MARIREEIGSPLPWHHGQGSRTEKGNNAEKASHWVRLTVNAGRRQLLSLIIAVIVGQEVRAGHPGDSQASVTCRLSQGPKWSSIGLCGCGRPKASKRYQLDLVAEEALEFIFLPFWGEITGL